ncbi:Sec-independent protein translocase protein TatB [Mameliella sediminis]|uniref:Sec-independent protein translocase protein TatB n=1 Tax=Mameliella sediminis TaxID=2836866 RepID=UPI001C4509BF|nr:Sec-independent protein translocase protein TatB [Mameliella sediminis]MBY6114676.1 Sec-independent protein translocase protein TatB [Antarctobacter heliothermus]MBY6144249.1 Sec-independent protein translocase protein TatB [Mameliella alba]MBV7392843.1 Sec-independent protein translocase protein TatB [Mameliella sediminis]MBY6161459.1 Sec-independent protein translocase protein TatB [Mameliella alba]MBY6170075.1 Sec-independent protein translocase protein TatB [Mameliella alba]
MFDLGFGELLVIGIVALIIVGPKDLPVLFRNVGRFMGKARGMAREFSRAMNEAADESGVRDVAKSLKTATNPVGSAMDGVKDAAKSMTSFDPDSETGKLAKERDDARKKIEANAARKAAERKQREAEDAVRRAEELEASLKADEGGAPAEGDTKA